MANPLLLETIKRLEREVQQAQTDVANATLRLEIAQAQLAAKQTFVEPEPE